MWTVSFIMGQIMTLISYIIYWYSRFQKKKTNMLVIDTSSRFFAFMGFLVLKSYDGIKMTLFVVARNLICNALIKKDKKYKAIMFIILFFILIGLYAFSFNGIATICIAICGIINLIGVIFLKEQQMRIATMIGSTFYAVFLLLSSNYTGAICEIITFAVNLISFLKYNSTKSHRTNTKKIKFSHNT